MEPPKFQRKFEELKRCLLRINKLYNGQIISGQGEDSFQSPKDIALSFFRVSYELKEALKNDNQSPRSFKGNNGLVENFCNTEADIALSLDIANQEKHISLNRSRSKKEIGIINTHVHLFSPDENDRTELTIEIDKEKNDLLEIAKKIFVKWEIFFTDNLS